MRVIAGIAKGTRLYTPTSRLIRPTLDRVRTSLFDIIGGDIEGKYFLDLFAGTGANGIEALSRGAEKAWFVDISPYAIELIRRNLLKTHLSDRGVVLRARLPGEVGILPKGVDYVYVDPPYSFEQWEELIEGLVGFGVVKEGSLVIMEHSRRSQLPESFGGIILRREEKYGDTVLSFYRFGGDGGS